MYKSSLMVALLGVFSISSVMAAEIGHGKVNFMGEIVDSPCSIAAESVDQTVDFGQISNTSLADGGVSPTKNFTIELQNCSFSDATWTGKNKVTITFSGATVGTGAEELLGMTGFAGTELAKTQNVGIQINDAKNDKIVLGQPLEIMNIQDGNNTLLFSSFVKGRNVTVDQIPLGEFKAVSNFTIAYN